MLFVSINQVMTCILKQNVRLETRTNGAQTIGLKTSLWFQTNCLVHSLCNFLPNFEPYTEPWSSLVSTCFTALHDIPDFNCCIATHTLITLVRCTGLTTAENSKALSPALLHAKFYVARNKLFSTFVT